ncbi:MAG TPA: DUF4089 domain-containing protein [Stellaceae bacterium]|jgi:hypothetical protein|nr:DUF4089 domain-containing protein [Stellaceae bacterium]
MADTPMDLDTLAKLAGLDIPQEYRDGVTEQLAPLMARAKEVMSVPLPDELEPAAIFTLRGVSAP